MYVGHAPGGTAGGPGIAKSPRAVPCAVPLTLRLRPEATEEHPMSIARQSRPWNHQETNSEDERTTLLPGGDGPASRTRERVREAIPSPPPDDEISAKGPSSIS